MNDYWFCWEPKPNAINEFMPCFYAFDPDVRDLNRPREERCPQRRGKVKLSMSQEDAEATGILGVLALQYPLPEK